MNDMSHIPAGVHPLALGSQTAKKDSCSEQFDLRLTPVNRWELFEHAPDAMLACDTKGRIVDINARCLQLFGYAGEELIGAKVEALIPQRFGASHEGLREGYLSVPRPRPMDAVRDLFGLRKDGSEVPVEVDLGVVECDGCKLVLAVIRDRGERILAAQQLREQSDIDRRLAELSAKFINLPPDRVDGEITNGLMSLADALGGDRASLGLLEANSGDLLITHAWARPGIQPFPRRMLRGVLPWLTQRILAGDITVISSPDELPIEAHVERDHMEATGAKSSLIVPLRVSGSLVGALAYSSFRERQQWNPGKISRFQALADVFANALARKLADENLHSAYAEIQHLKEQLEQENTYLRQEIKLEYSHKIVVGDSAAIRGVLKKAEQVASTDSTVLVVGETGTGKELIARTIHEMSGRSKRTMVKTNCAALPATLIESELFGREKGAYTGALAREIGRFELADQSTIFLDEIGELPPEVQSKLLRVLQEGEFERLGSSKTIKVNVRVIAATSRDLPAMMREGKFRADLFYRLNVFPIVVPPLRDRIEDIPALVWHILGELGSRMGRKIDGVEANTMEALQRYSWPGNVRELRNVIERSLILNTGPILRAEVPNLEDGPNRKMRGLDKVESDYFLEVLQATKWRIRGKGGAAEILNVKPTTLEAKIKKLGISRPD
jgi:formate hydrogenlyase transcriptional activator